eukprot:CAMPEP_0113970224 /NCGR_PEP_ID=MMETSP0011_2-20120614/10990_1 /TAXON_ID=101924 /ORGANISM="Rhodosorus marinus" /LENGTH=131 /DNA_ID=CAMNT_0000984441 /DNA_START=27 /DNA_END=422 /DNA_ORIENTATION=- /assembly_acc=CAM_ASM_000156
MSINQVGPTDESAERDLPPPPIVEVPGVRVDEDVDPMSTSFLFRLWTLPCFRDSTLTGVASGFSVGVLRALRTRNGRKGLDVFVGLSAVVSGVSWVYCRANYRQERERAEAMVALALDPPPPPGTIDEVEI